VIALTFEPLLGTYQKMPQQLTSELLQRFSTQEGYAMYPDVLRFFGLLRTIKHTQERLPDDKLNWNWDNTIIGLITNSDDRVSGVLRSFGLKISPLRYSKDKATHVEPRTINDDVNFVILSYDVDHGKPNQVVFDAAEQLLSTVIATQRLNHAAESFEKLHVGDDWDQDYQGAKKAGWHALHLDRGGTAGSDEPATGKITDLMDLVRWQP
jgi:hypothetical protein